jgi:hypothetical protein
MHPVLSRARLALALGLIGLSAAVPSVARAQSMDLAPERFALQPSGLPPGQTCQSTAANPEAAVAAGIQPNSVPCRADDVAFANLTSELGFAMGGNAFHPAHTTGIGGFALTFEASFTGINANGESVGKDGSRRKYWQDGTVGAKDARGAYPTRNTNPDGFLGLYALKARKGLPLGFEVAAQLGWLGNTSMWVPGADLRWAPLEGFRTGALGYLPDIAIGGGVRTLAGTGKLTLTTVGVDVQISKPIAIADVMKLTPYAGFQRLYVFADSNTVDLTPNVDAMQQCGFEGRDPTTGAPLCRNTLSNGTAANGDFNNNVVFEKVRTHRNRMILGFNLRYEFVYFASQVLFDLTAPSDENPGLSGTRQWTLSFEGGVYF